MLDSSASEWLKRIPKVELHLHLEGAIPLDALWELIRKYGGHPDAPSLAALRSKFTFHHFAHFIETWIWKNQFLREYEDFTLISTAVARDLAAQNIRYVEAFYSPPDFARHGLETGRLTEAIRAGLDQVPEVEIGLVADFVRDFGPATAKRTLSELAEVASLGVLGVGIGGSEQEFPPEPFAEVFEMARERGFRTSAHAGEAAGPASIWGAIRSLKVDRVGHATRAEEDPLLLDYLAEQRIPLEMCPISNLRTGVVGSLAEHPIRRYHDRGLVVSVNTDDPKMFGNSLAQEYQQLMTVHNFSRTEIQTLVMQAIEASWLSEERSHKLRAGVLAHPAWQETAE